MKEGRVKICRGKQVHYIPEEMIYNIKPGECMSVCGIKSQPIGLPICNTYIRNAITCKNCLRVMGYEKYNT